MIKEEDEDDALANIYLEGLDILKDHPKETAHKDKMKEPESPARGAMIIHTGTSNDSMSGIRLDSRSTLESVHWGKTPVKRKELPRQCDRKKEKKFFIHVQR